jgi:hypothetical protein
MKIETFGKGLLYSLMFVGVNAAWASGVTIDAVSEPQLFPCLGCSLSAVEGSASTLGSGTHILYDLSGNKIYRAICEPAGGATISCGATPLSSGDFYTWFVGYRAAWLNNAQSEAFHPAINVVLPSNVPHNSAGGLTDDGLLNAWDTLTYSSANNAVEANLASQIGTTVTLVSPSFSGVIYDTDGSCIAVVTFHDKSTRTYTLNKQLHQFEPLANSAHDSDHNTLPESKPSGFQGYTFSDPTGYNVTNMTLLLAPASLPDDGLEGGCTSESWDGTKVSCKHPY